MTTTTPTTVRAPGVDPVKRPDGFQIVISATNLGYNLPQRMARRLWLPMFAMALAGWAIGFTLAIVEAGTDRADAETLQQLSHLVPAFMFVGFLGVFSAIIFAVARILGVLRKGGGEVQETSGTSVQTLAMPSTGKMMLGLMAMGMMVMLAGIIANFWAAGSFGIEASEVLDSRAWAAAASGLRRMGTALYLAGIAFGLGTIIDVLRFQSTRVGEVAERAGHSHD
jgi:hypothetical protein